MPDTPNATRDIDSDIAGQIERLRETVRHAAASEHVDNARMGILNLLDQLLQQPSRAAGELARRSMAKLKQ